MNNITTGLIQCGHEVQVLTIHTQKHPWKPECFPKGYAKKTNIKGVFVDTRVNMVDAFSNLITSDSYNISRFFSTDFDKLLSKTLQESDFDVVHLESLFMTPYLQTIRRNSESKIVLRSHNLEYMIWERIASGTSNAPKKWYLRHLARLLKKYELGIFPQIDGIAAITNMDKKKYLDLGCKKPMVTIPFGIDLSKYPTPKEEYEFPGLFHLGSMDWMPNLEGVRWLIKEVWSIVLSANPDAKLFLAGRKMPEEFNNLQSTIQNDGEVADAMDYMASKGIMLVPLLSGGGMRVKIIEGMALGKTIISTKIGAEGIDYEDGKDLIIADTPGQFAAAIARLSRDPDYARTLGANARKLAETRYDNSNITQQLIQFYESLQSAS